MIDYHIHVESSEDFAYSGDKQSVARILPLAEVVKRYVIYAIGTGWGKLPKVCVGLRKMVEGEGGKEKVVRGKEAGDGVGVNFGAEGVVWVQPRYVLE
jgi:hypothetical protein